MADIPRGVQRPRRGCPPAVGGAGRAVRRRRGGREPRLRALRAVRGRADRRGLGGWGWGPQPPGDEAPGPRAISSEGAPIGADSAVGAGDPNRTAMRPAAEEPSASRKSAPYWRTL